jgi:hypothetical protein
LPEAKDLPTEGTVRAKIWGTGGTWSSFTGPERESIRGRSWRGGRQSCITKPTDDGRLGISLSLFSLIILYSKKHNLLKMGTDPFCEK